MVQMVPKFKYGRGFKDLSQEEVFDRISSWLVQEGAAISLSHRPQRIEATHGSSELSFGDRNAQMRLVISLSDRHAGTFVEIVASPASWMDAVDVISTSDRRGSAWAMLSAELWEHIEGAGDASAYSGHWTKERSLSVLNKVAGVRIMIGGAMIVTIGLLVAEAAQGAVFVSVIGLFTILWGAIKYWFGSKRIAR